MLVFCGKALRLNFNAVKASAQNRAAYIKEEGCGYLLKIAAPFFDAEASRFSTSLKRFSLASSL
jgi:hypothetical protein